MNENPGNVSAKTYVVITLVTTAILTFGAIFSGLGSIIYETGTKEAAATQTAIAILTQNPQNPTSVSPYGSSPDEALAQKPESTGIPNEIIDPTVAVTPFSASETVNPPTTTPIPLIVDPLAFTPVPPTFSPPSSTPVPPASPLIDQVFNISYSEESIDCRVLESQGFVPVSAVGECAIFSDYPGSAEFYDYTAVVVDDNLEDVKIVCPDSSYVITSTFEKFRPPDEGLYHWRGRVLNIGPGCHVDFVIRDEQGINIGLLIKPQP